MKIYKYQKQSRRHLDVIKEGEYSIEWYGVIDD